MLKHSFRTEKKLKHHKNVYKNYDYCCVETPKEDHKILKYNHREKSMKVLFIIYTDMECLLEKMSTCHNNPKKLPTTKITEYTPLGFPLFTHCTFDTQKGWLLQR